MNSNIADMLIDTDRNKQVRGEGRTTICDNCGREMMLDICCGNLINSQDGGIFLMLTCRYQLLLHCQWGPNDFCTLTCHKCRGGECFEEITGTGDKSIFTIQPSDDDAIRTHWTLNRETTYDST